MCQRSCCCSLDDTAPFFPHWSHHAGNSLSISPPRPTHYPVQKHRLVLPLHTRSLCYLQGGYCYCSPQRPFLFPLKPRRWKRASGGAVSGITAVTLHFFPLPNKRRSKPRPPPAQSPHMHLAIVYFLLLQKHDATRWNQGCNEFLVNTLPRSFLTQTHALHLPVCWREHREGETVRLKGNSSDTSSVNSLTEGGRGEK